LLLSLRRRSATKYVEFYQNIGALVIRFSKEVKGDLCKRCINKHFWSLTLTTLFLGWWGMISLIVTPFFLLNNIFRYLGALSLQPPTPGAVGVTAELTDDVIEKLKPFTNDLLQLLQAGKPIEQAAPLFATKAGVTPQHVALYFQVLQHLANKK